MSWDAFINAARQGRLPDVEFEKVAEKKKPSAAPNPLAIFGQASKQAATAQKQMQKVEKSRQADDWLNKLGFIDASQMGGGGGMDPAAMGGGGGAPPMPPGMPPEMMGGGMPPGGMPMDPSMMGMGGGMPPMDPMMMQQQGMMGGMGGGMMGGDPMMGSDGKKLKAEDLIRIECGRIKELLNGLYIALDLKIPPSAVSGTEMARAIIDQQKRDAEKQQLEQSSGPADGSRINPMESLLSQGNKIGSEQPIDDLVLARERLDAIIKYIKK